MNIKLWQVWAMCAAWVIADIMKWFFGGPLTERAIAGSVSIVIFCAGMTALSLFNWVEDRKREAA
ncbi:hypothetical protein ACW7BJ_16200 [Azospirillum argentinense]